VNCKCIEILTREHKTILRIAEVLEAMSRRAQDLAEQDQDDAESILHVLRVFGDDFHQAKEESALFPIFMAVCNASQQAAVRHMLFEHEQDRQLMSGMQNAIARSNAAQFAEYATRLANTLRIHIHKEDNILFEIIVDTLTPDDDARVIKEFEEPDRDFKEQYEGQVFDQLRTLEWKYLRRSP
jgi:hemerythrin-like domain-containing protein